MMLSVGLATRATAPAVAPGQRRRRIGQHLRALLLNLVLIPLAAVALTRTLHLSGAVAVALLLVAATPGGRFAPHLTRIADGDVALATQQTLILARLTVLTAPLTAKWLLGLHDLHLHALPIALRGLVLQALPLYLGKRLRQHYHPLADRLERPLRIFITTSAIAALAAFIATNRFRSVELLGDRGWIAVALLVLASVALSWLCGGAIALLRRTFAIGALSRNLALALLVGGLAFPDTKVQLAVFGVWWVLSGSSYLYALLAGHKPRRQLIPVGQSPPA